MRVHGGLGPEGRPTLFVFSFALTRSVRLARRGGGETTGVGPGSPPATCGPYPAPARRARRVHSGGPRLVFLFALMNRRRSCEWVEIDGLLRGRPEQSQSLRQSLINNQI
ncbi:uncharacterized protein K452DRAFT_146154 [Aplosporella prunicola CBS 121167]|uniref:Uncharacterized protein n=1 Tax=Aplosporella prunicola CBS 121167 TaxID=1176127 RepID=A0A6A6BKS7_9PEZI|nr:uncharacterized protein K452DRAFT_146154 [Aplosporella prunicola CBS 121167]KAF2144732.1 hypothetical protein K452DRAFT_146154 [Aplosporella prunicola CBS 121167]